MGEEMAFDPKTTGTNCTASWVGHNNMTNVLPHRLLMHTSKMGQKVISNESSMNGELLQQLKQKPLI